LTQFFGGGRRSAEPLERRAGNIGVDPGGKPGDSWQIVHAVKLGSTSGSEL
jgi:hypothetical protein